MAAAASVRAHRDAADAERAVGLSQQAQVRDRRALLLEPQQLRGRLELAPVEVRVGRALLHREHVLAERHQEVEGAGGEVVEDGAVQVGRGDGLVGHGRQGTAVGADHRASAQGAAGCSRVQPARRLRTRWQRGHQNTVRAAISPERTVVPHSRQGRVWRW